jgi:hypothetical protein
MAASISLAGAGGPGGPRPEGPLLREWGRSIDGGAVTDEYMDEVFTADSVRDAAFLVDGPPA